jgi:hypothetical protein
MTYEDKHGQTVAVGDVVKDSLGALVSIKEFHWTDAGTAVSVSGSSFKHLARNVVLVERKTPCDSPS